MKKIIQLILIVGVINGIIKAVDETKSTISEEHEYWNQFTEGYEPQKEFEETMLKKKALKELRKKSRFNIDFYKEDPLTALYKMPSGHFNFYIPEQDLMDINELKNIFENNDIRTGDTFLFDKQWSTKEWNKAYKYFKKAQYDEAYITSYKNYNYIFYTLNELLKLLAKAKEVIGSFLPTDDFSFIFKKNNYIEKYGLNRLYTYAKLQQVITEENLTHIRLPLKFLLIEDNETGKYVSTEEALQVIDNTLKICVSPHTECTIRPISNRYSFHIFAKKEMPNGDFSRATMTQLFILCEKAPFDIGYDNIFSDIKGDAVIIDTEHKREPAYDCYKLKRYRVNESL